MKDALRGLTTRGRSFLAAGIAVVLAAMAVSETDLLRVGVLLATLPVLSALMVSRTRYRLSSRRRLGSGRTAAGQEAVVTLRLENISRLPTGLLLVEDKVPYVLGSRPRFVLDRVEPRGRREVSYVVRSEVRGRYPLGPLSIRLTDPFGMCELHRSFAARDALVVTPPVSPLPKVPLSGEWTGSGESRSRSLASAGDDDAGIREYRQGDDLRRVHWRSTARLDKVMVRREEQPWQARATILLDTRTAAHGGEGPGSSFEWAITACASIGAHLLHHGYHVRLNTDTGETLAGSDVSLDGGLDVEGALLDALAVVTTSSLTSLRDASAALRRTGSDGLLVAVLGRLDLEEARLLSRLRHGSTAAIAVLLDTPSWSLRGRGSVAGAARVGGTSSTAAPTASVVSVVSAASAAAALLRASGWRVVEASAGDQLAELWPAVGRHAAAPVRIASASGRA